MKHKSEVHGRSLLRNFQPKVKLNKTFHSIEDFQLPSLNPFPPDNTYKTPLTEFCKQILQRIDKLEDKLTGISQV